jgi:hypothetical protein
MTEVEKMLAIPPAEVRRLLSNSKFKALRKSYFDRFPKVMGILHRKVCDMDLASWWRDYVMNSRVRFDWVRDGWLTGKDYG